MQAYLVCATPRSGSTLLCEMLRDTELAGRPLEHFEILRHSNLPRQPHEYFGDLDLDGLDELLPPPRAGIPSQEAPEVWRARILRQGRGENGVWGGKLMWGHVEDLVVRARQLPGLAGAGLEQVLHALLDDPQLVLVTRRDKFAQAVSLWRAVQTQSWRADDASKAETPIYEFAAIDHLVLQLESDERSWKEWFARSGQRPFVVTYDQLERAPAETVSTVLQALVLPDAGVPDPPLSRQRDELSSVAEKAFRPLPLPFPVLHVDTSHNFPEVIELRDRSLLEAGHRLIVASVQASIDTGRVKEDTPGGSRNRLQTVTLLDALEQHGFDAAFGGARRDEERARAKERMLSFRDEFGQWEPRAQRAEPWTLYNARIRRGEHIRVFPLSNWTELDVWRYIEAEELELPSIYFAHRRRVVERDRMLLAESEWIRPRANEQVEEAMVRYRTVGDLTVTGAVRSEAADIPSVIAETEAATVSERGETRADDRTSEAAMEDRKREGYF